MRLILESATETDKVEELVRKELSLVGKPLEDAVLDILWTFREAKSPSATTPPVRHTIVRQTSPAPWQIPRASTPTTSPALGRASPAPPPGFGVAPPSFLRSRSYGGASPFNSPRPSPRLAFASPIPHSPNLSTYEFSEPSSDRNDYGDYGSGTQIPAPQCVNLESSYMKRELRLFSNPSPFSDKVSKSVLKSLHLLNHRPTIVLRWRETC